MFASVDRGLSREGSLPGGLKVRRRAKAIFDRLIQNARMNAHAAHEIMDYVAVYAMAVNEENAAGGRVVTAPTNGAAGVIPAVMRDYRDHCSEASAEGLRTFVLTAAAIGALFKMNASISGGRSAARARSASPPQWRRRGSAPASAARTRKSRTRRKSQ